MKGAFIVTYTNDDGFAGDYIEIKNNNSIVKRIYSNSNRLYSIPIVSGDVVSIEFITSGLVSIDLKRLDFTLDDEDGDKGIKQTSITPSVVGKKYTFTATTINDAYDFQYIFDSNLSDAVCMTIGTGFTNFSRCVATQSTGKYLIGGTLSRFSGVTISGITRLEENGTLDSTFTQNSRRIENVEMIYVNNDDTYIECGFGNSGTFNLTKYLSGGTVDTTFQNNPSVAGGVTITRIGKQSSGKYIFVGSFSEYPSGSGKQYRRIVRVDNSGYTDSSFLVLTGATGLNNQIDDLYIYPDDKILCAGTFTNYSGVTNYYRGLIRFNSDGSLDTTFNIGTGFTSSSVTGIDLQSNGKIICVGAFTSFNGNSVNSICRLNSNGSFDNTFLTGFTSVNNNLTDIKVLPDDKILISGLFTNYGGVNFGGNVILLRLNSDGSLDTTFNRVLCDISIAEQILITSKNEILVAGSIKISSVSPTINGFVKFDINGNLITNNC